MEDTESKLVDDTWVNIFSYIPTFERAKLAQVSRKWQDLSRRPLVWKQIEVSLPHYSSNENFSRLDGFFAHLFTNCTAITDLHLQLGSNVPFTSTHFNEILQIKSLRRLVFKWNPLFYSQEFSLEAVAACRDLRLLNLTSFAQLFNDEELTILLSGLPNLEELYFGRFPRRQFTVKPFALTPKLQRLSYSSSLPIDHEELVKTCPSLKFVVEWATRGLTMGASPSIFKTIGDTVILTSDILNDLTQDRLKLVGPILTPYLSNSAMPYLALAIATNSFSERIAYLVKELHFDVNGWMPEFPYRPSFIEAPEHVKAESRRDLVHYALNCITKQVLETLLELGASAECPNTYESYLVRARNPDEIMLLLKHGADPNKIVKAIITTGLRSITDFIPAYAETLRSRGKVAINSLFDVPKYTNVDVLNEFAKHNCDFNINIGDQTLFEILIRGEKFDLNELIPAMLNVGAKLNTKILGLLLLRSPQKVKEMFINKEIEIGLISTQLMAFMIINEMQDLLEEIIEEKAMEVDSEGLTPLHHLVALQYEISIQNQPERTTRAGPRWQVSLPEQSQKRFGFTNLRAPTPPSSLKAASFQLGESTPSPTISFQTQTAQTSTLNLSFTFGSKVNFSFGQAETLPAKPASTQERLTVELLKRLQSSVDVRSNTGETALLTLCKSNISQQVLKDRVDMLLEIGANVNIADNNSWTPLHAALYIRSWDVAKMLVKHGANLNAQDRHGVTPLMAALYGFKHFDAQMFDNFDENFIELLKNEQVDLSLTTKYFKQTLLHLLACVGSDALGEIVLERSLGGINARDANGFTPLHYAVMYDNYHMIPLLLKQGADVSAQTTLLRLTPLMVFLSMVSTDSPFQSYLSNYNVLMFATRQQRYFGSKSLGGALTYPKITEAPWNVDHHNREGASPHFTTEVEGVMEKIWNLLEKTDCTLIDAQGNNLLHYILSYAQFNITVANSVINHYEQHSSVLKSMWGKKNCLNNTPFSLVCRHFIEKTADQSSVVTLYNLAKEFKIDMNEPDGRGYSPLHYILKSTISAYLKTQFFNLPGVDMVGDIRVQNNFINTVLEQQRTFVMVENDLFTTLVRANPNSVNACGMTVLMQLILKYAMDTTQQHLSKLIDVVLSSDKVDINARDNNGNTALHLACKLFHTGLLESIFGHIGNAKESASYFLLPFKLLQAGADPILQNNDGETPITFVPELMLHYKQLFNDWIHDHAKKFVLM